MDTVILKWGGKRRFVGTDVAGHEVVADTPVESGGDGSGVRPLELALMALGGCTGMDVISILEKQREDVTGFEVVVTGTQREEYPKIYSSVHVEYVVRGRGVSVSHVERAIALSEEKYCSVRGMLGTSVEISSSYRIEEA